MTYLLYHAGSEEVNVFMPVAPVFKTFSVTHCCYDRRLSTVLAFGAVRPQLAIDAFISVLGLPLSSESLVKIGFSSSRKTDGKGDL